MEGFDNWCEVKRYIVAKFSDWSFTPHKYSLKEQLRPRQTQFHLALRNLSLSFRQATKTVRPDEARNSQASNFLIQGAAADIAKMEMVKLHSALPDAFSV